MTRLSRSARAILPPSISHSGGARSIFRRFSCGPAPRSWTLMHRNLWRGPRPRVLLIAGGAKPLLYPELGSCQSGIIIRPRKTSAALCSPWVRCDIRTKCVNQRLASSIAAGKLTKRISLCLGKLPSRHLQTAAVKNSRSLPSEDRRCVRLVRCFNPS
jgi:hypothetical protein